MPGQWLPFCRPDHAVFHANCRRAGVNFKTQRNPILRYLQAIKALLVALWMVIEALEKHAKTQSEGDEL
jgi:hypothetical protein